MTLGVLWGASGFTQIVNIEDRRLDHQDSSQLGGYIDLGASITQNGSNIVTMEASGQLEYLAGKHLWLVYGNYRQVIVNDNNFINRRVGHARYNYSWKEWLTWEGFAQGQYNERLRIAFRGLLGTGPRFNLSPQANSNVYIGLSYMYEYESWLDTSIVFSDSRVNSYISFSIPLGKQVDFASTNYYQPLISDFELFRVSSNSSLQIKISDALSYRLGFSITLDNRLGEGLPEVPSTTYNLTNSLRWRF